MAVVKGSKIHRVKVVEDRPFLRWFVLLILLALAALAVYVSYDRGHAIGLARQQSAVEGLQAAEKNLAAARSRVLELEQSVANVNLGAEVDKQANEEIRQEVISLKEQIAVLEEENGFYRGLMAPTENKSGLTFGSVELSKSERERSYSYKIVVQQLATNHQLLSGTLSCKIVGRMDGEDKSYDLNQVSGAVTERDVKLRFKYFQTIEGELRLPVGFEPLGIELVARTSGKKPVTIEKRFGWLAEEAL